jgi:hypothetical protein
MPRLGGDPVGLQLVGDGERVVLVHTAISVDVTG